jgi:hypothetical protein
MAGWCVSARALPFVAPKCLAGVASNAHASPIQRIALTTLDHSRSIAVTELAG